LWLWFVLGIRSEWLCRVVLREGRQSELALVLPSLAVSFGLDRVEPHLFFVCRSRRLRLNPLAAIGTGHISGATADAATSEAVKAP